MIISFMHALSLSVMMSGLLVVYMYVRQWYEKE